ncbi:fungal-specific transcription factor domain-containing protein [Sphaerosporella brunnea]|uniref:Fungal-specific transcription factor domain-containing protein n=1 Tax=Sphaerosporella brunnea TaxID=1250544 RepID=A0A5J5EUE9_9PEZI|nr:fungal-specific transcription factor domain-containing protein [Sphaerosporella brunnea]
MPMEKRPSPTRDELNDESCVRKEPRRNISRACEPCRQRKVKCDGQRPICGHCTDYKLDCFYGGTKKELTEKRLRDLEIRVETYATLLRGLQPFADSNGQLAIQNALASNVDVSISPALSPSSLYGQSTSDSDSERSGDEKSSASWELGADTFAFNDAIGFMGVGSGVSLVRTVERELSKDMHYRRESLEQSTFPMEARSSAYHLDNRHAQLSMASEIHMYYTPNRATADKLLNVYLTTVHPLLPIMWKPTLLDNYDKIYAFDMPPQMLPNCDWTTLNLVFAISQTFLALLGEDDAQDGYHHGDYFNRARVLGALDGTSVFSIADLEQVRILGLCGIYLLASNQTNRAWNSAGLAIRMAYGIGLHVRNDPREMTIQEQEQRLRVWHSLYYLDSLLSLVTGRPPAIQERTCSAPVPRMLIPNVLTGTEDIDPVVPDPYMVACTSLSAITAEMMSRLYSPRSIFQENSLDDLRRNIELLSCFLQRWKRDLPVSLDFEEPQTDQTFLHQRVELALRYHHTTMLLNRPCLRRPDPRSPGLPPSTREFMRDGAVRCLDSAHQLIYLIVHGLAADPTNPIRMGPWWAIMHYAVSAESIVLLELAYRAVHAPHHCETMFVDASDLILWLDAIASMGKNEGAQRCCQEFTDLLKRIAPRLNRVFDGPTTSLYQRTHTGIPGLQDRPPSSEMIEQYFPAPSFLHEPGSSGYIPPFSGR